MRRLALPRLLRTTVFRLSLLYAVSFSLVVALSLGGVYWFASHYVNSQIDVSLNLEARQVQGGAEVEPDDLRESVAQLAQNGLAHGRFYLLETTDDRVLAGNLRYWPPDIARRAGYADFSAEAKAIPRLARSTDSDVRVRVLISALPQGGWLLIGQALSEEEEFTDYMGYLLFWALVLISVSALAGGVWMGRSVLKRIDVIGATAGEIMAGRLSRRVPVLGRNDEFDQLATRLNEMLARIDELIRGMRDVTDNVAHDLRSPLTRLRNRLEVTLLEDRPPAEYRAVITQAIDDADRLLGTFNTLLAIAQAEAGVRRGAFSRLDLGNLCRDLVEFYTVAAEEAGLMLTAHAPSGLWIEGNRDLLTQALSNLIDNALKYVPAGGRIDLSVQSQGHFVVLQVRDNGPGIPAEADRRAVLGRFVRLDTARSAPGNGLGLSLVKATMQAHHASITLADAAPGLIVELRFPRA